MLVQQCDGSDQGQILDVVAAGARAIREESQLLREGIHEV